MSNPYKDKMPTFSGRSLCISPNDVSSIPNEQRLMIIFNDLVLTENDIIAIAHGIFVRSYVPCKILKLVNFKATNVDWRLMCLFIKTIQNFINQTNVLLAGVGKTAIRVQTNIISTGG